MKVFVGIGDARGLSSFLQKYLGEGHNLKREAALGRDRKAVYFECDLNESDAQKIADLHNGGDNISALLELKERAKNLKVEPGQSRAWAIIPDPKLLIETKQNKLFD